MVLGAASPYRESGWGSWVLQQGSQHRWGCDLTAVVRNIIYKMSWAQTEPLEKTWLGLCSTSCPERNGIWFYHKAFARQIGFPFSAPVARTSLFLQTGPWCGWATCFQVSSFPGLDFYPKLEVQISGLARAGKGKMSYRLSNELELNTISSTKVITQTGFSFSLIWFVKLPYANQF